VRFRSLLVAGVLATGSPLTAAAAPYVLAEAKNDSLMIVDHGTIRTNGGARRVWDYLIFKEPADGAVYIAAQDEFDCAGKRTRVLYAQSYDEHGNPIGDGRAIPTKWSRVIPRSTAEFVMKESCSGVAAEPLSLPKDATVDQIVGQIRAMMRKPGWEKSISGD
jgi:hypothetical protein